VLSWERDYILVRTRYHTVFVAQLKSLPVGERKYDPARKAWAVDAKHAQTLIGWIHDAFGVTVTLPPVPVVTSAPEIALLEVRYLGACKERAGSYSAYGYVDGGWNALFPENVLRAYFGEKERKPDAPQDESNLYQRLGVVSDVTIENLKKSYRRMARQWHPDVCSESDAKERFIAIQSAYELLSDSNKRARYDAGMQLIAQSHKVHICQTNFDFVAVGFRSPLRCGRLLVEGLRSLGQFRVNRILDWQDISDDHGRVLVTSWPMGAKQFVEKWVEAT